MLAALATLILSGQAPTITFESPGITVKAFCAEMSRQTGNSFVAKDEIQTDLLAIRVNKVPLDELIKKIEYVERAKLDFEGKTYTIRPDAKVRAELKAERFVLRVQAVKETQAFMSQYLRSKTLDDTEAKAVARKLSALQAGEKTLDENGPDNASVNVWVRKENESLRMPDGQALLKMFLAIPAEDLAAIDVHGGEVWSTAATAIEHQTPLDPSILLADVEHEQTVWRDAASKFLSPDATQYFSRGQSETPSTEQAMLLRLDCGGSRRGSFVLDFTGFDRSGKQLYELVKSTWLKRDLDETAAPSTKQDTQLELVSISPATAKLIELWASFPGAEEMRKWAADKEFLNLYFNPERFDPVAETFGRALLELAKARGKQLVAAESGQDAFALRGDFVVKGKLNVGSLETALSANREGGFPAVHYAGDATWITIRPRDLEEAASEEFDRAGLGIFLRTARDKRVIGLMDVARYAADKACSLGIRSTDALSALEPLLPDLAGMNLINEGSWPIKSLLGRLDANQIAVAQQPDGLSLENCTPSQLEAVWRAFRYTRLSYRGKTDVWHSFITDGIPRGLPGGGALHLSTEAGPSLRARIQHNRGGWVENRYFTPDELSKRLTQLYAGGAENYSLLGFRPAKRTRYEFRFDFPNDITTTEDLDDDATTGPEVKSADQLPEPLRSQVKAAIQKAGAP